jgi:hypothetical protein
MDRFSKDEQECPPLYVCFRPEANHLGPRDRKFEIPFPSSGESATNHADACELGERADRAEVAGPFAGAFA